jgi:hypothetical protein
MYTTTVDENAVSDRPGASRLARNSFGSKIASIRRSHKKANTTFSYSAEQHSDISGTKHNRIIPEALAVTCFGTNVWASWRAAVAHSATVSPVRIACDAKLVSMLIYYNLYMGVVCIPRARGRRHLRQPEVKNSEETDSPKCRTLGN